MAILAECPFCRKKHKLANKKCWNEKTQKGCGADLDQAKRSGSLKYWISYRLPGGKQRREYIGTSITDARDAESKRRVEKRENRLFDVGSQAKMTFKELTKWYLGLEKVKAVKSYWRVEIGLRNFNSRLGSKVVRKIKPVDLEDYQVKRTTEGASPSTVDKELTMVHTMVNKACDNDLVSADTLRTFKRVKRLQSWQTEPKVRFWLI